MNDPQNWAETMRSSSSIKKMARLQKEDEGREKRKGEREKKGEITRTVRALSSFMRVEFPTVKKTLEAIEELKEVKSLKEFDFDSRIKVLDEEVVYEIYRPHIYLTARGFGYMEQTLPSRGHPYGVIGRLRKTFLGEYRFKKFSILEIVRLWSEKKSPSELLPYMRRELDKKAVVLKKANNILYS